MAATWRRSGRQRASLAGNRSTPTERPTGATQAKSGEPLFWRKRATGDFAAEIEAHIQLEAERLREQGLSEPAARAAARRAFGNVLRAQERFYESGRWRWWDDLARDLRYALRLLRRSPGFTAIAVATLALAIGANAVAFGVLNAALLRPLNVPDPQSLVALQPQRGDNSLHLSYPTYLDYRDRNHSFAGLAANRIGQAGLDAGANPAPVWLDEVSGNYFDVLRLRPYLGRFFHGSEEHGANSMPEVVLAWAYWHSHFHGDPGVVGRTLRLNKQPFAVVGVAPPGFNGTLLFGAPALFVPLVNEQQIEGSNYLNARGERALFMTFGHLKPGVTAAQAIADLNAIGAALRRRFPLSELATDFTLASPSLYGNFLGPPVRAFAAALMLLAGLVLLAACANLGSLFAARATDHAREVAVRLALGAGWGRVARQLCTEALLIALAGGGLGLWGGVALLRWLSAWHPFPQAPITLPLSPDAHVYAAALLLAVASAFLFIAEPVRQVWRTQPYTIIKQGAARRPRRMNAREWLLGVQIALCAVLVTASLVAVRGLARSLQGNVGFEPANVMLAQSDLGMAGYGNAAAPPMQRRMLAAVAALPGVQSVGMADWAPLGLLGWNSEQVFTAQTTDLRAANAAADAAIFNASPGYLETARTTLLAGRSFTWHDDQAAPRVAVVNRRFAMLLFGSVARALGHGFK
ncbi:MAG: ABC transporter permease, partial [Terriglobales bacterium]